MKMNLPGGLLRWLAVLPLLLAAGCGQPTEGPATVPLASADVSRQRAFVQAVASALQSFERLDVPTVRIGADGPADGVPVVTVRDSSNLNPAYCEKAISLAIANVCLAFPGIRFQADGERTWKVLIPDDVLIPSEGPFDFGVLGKH